jgi:hypothetical protein
MLTPCSNYMKHRYSCILDLSTGLCSKCIGNNTWRTCNLVVPEEKFHWNTEDRSKLEQELEAAEDLMIVAHSKAYHLRHQLTLLDSRYRELFDCEIVSIEELE